MSKCNISLELGVFTFDLKIAHDIKVTHSKFPVAEHHKENTT